MRTLIITALIAATAMPGMAQAQSYGELHRDRREVRQDRREVRQDVRRGDYREARGDRRDLREDRRDYRQDINDRNRRWARNDWQEWRRTNRGVFAGAGWRAPFRYNAFRPGVRIRSVYYGPRYVIADPWRYHLPPAYGYQRWVRHYNDVLLIDTRRGVVVDVIHNFYW